MIKKLYSYNIPEILALDSTSMEGGNFSKKLSQETIEELLSTGTIWGYYSENRLIGSIALRQDGKIKLLRVDPEHRRKGIAKNLIKHLETEAKTQGLNRIYLGVAKDSTPAISLYRQLGYKEYDKQQKTEIIHAIYMEKIL